MTDPDWAALDAAWSPARRAGVLGGTPIEEIVTHAAGYLPAACRVGDEFSGIDLGTGAGVPGIVLALLRPHSRWMLVDASERRCELAQTAVRAMKIGSRVTVRHARAEAIAHEEEQRGSHDLVVARSFGPSADVAECGLPLVKPAGRLVVSVTAHTAALWLAAEDRLEMTVTTRMHAGDGRYVEVAPPGSIPESWPRRAARRRRSPLW